MERSIQPAMPDRPRQRSHRTNPLVVYYSKVEALTHQLGNSLWDHLLTGAEAAFRSGDPLWLDLQRYVCTAMKGLGPKFDRAREAVEAQTAAQPERIGIGLTVAKQLARLMNGDVIYRREDGRTVFELSLPRSS